jgi:hypothetical protein
MPCAINLLMRKQDTIWQKKMLKENPPKDDKRIRIKKTKTKTKTKTRKKRRKKDKIRRTTRE